MRNPTSGASSSSSSSRSRQLVATDTKSKSGTPCCSKVGLKRGPWTPEEDELLASYVRREGEGKWRTLPKQAGLLRCGKSCRLRWMNYLRPSVKRGQIAPDEEDMILRLHRLLGNRWSLIAGRIPGRTDNEIKNYWNTHMSKKLISQGIDPKTHKPFITPNPSGSEKDNQVISPHPSSSSLMMHETGNTSQNVHMLVQADGNISAYFDDTYLHTDGMVGSGGHHQAMELQRLINDDENAVVDDAYIADDDLLSSFLNSFLDEEEQQQIKGNITDGGICMEGIMDDDVVDLLAPSESLLGPLPALERRGF